MTVYSLLSELARLAEYYGNCQIKVNVPQLRPGDEGPMHINTLVIDQIDKNAVEILIEVKD